MKSVHGDLCSQIAQHHAVHQLDSPQLLVQDEKKGKDQHRSSAVGKAMPCFCFARGPFTLPDSRRRGTRLVRHAEFVRVHAHAAHAGHRKVKGRHRMAQLPREGQHETAQAGIHVAPYARAARDLRQRACCASQTGRSRGELAARSTDCLLLHPAPSTRCRVSGVTHATKRHASSGSTAALQQAQLLTSKAESAPALGKGA